MSDTSTDCPCLPDAGTTGIYNDPGQASLRYRIGTWGDFFDAMKADLSRFQIPSGTYAGTRPLAALTTRSTEDPAIALLDAASCVADVLTFYQERIANEGYLRTATERRSVGWLADAIGYILNPGVAASTWLAFTVEDAPTAPGEATVPTGLAVLSIPGQDESSQTFETTESRTVRATWNAIRPRLTEPQVPLTQSVTEILVSGVGTRLQVGDGILIVGDERSTVVGASAPTPSQDERWDFRILSAVETLPTQNLTRLAWDEHLGGNLWGHTVDPAQQNAVVYAMRARVPVFGYNAQPWVTQDLEVKRGWFDLYSMNGQRTGAEDSTRWNTDTTTGRARGWDSTDGTEPTDWPSLNYGRIYDLAPGATADTTTTRQIDLDGEQKGVTAGSWVVLYSQPYGELGQVQTVSFLSRTDFGVLGKVTRVTLDTREATVTVDGAGAPDELTPNRFTRANTTVFAQSEALVIAERPITDPFPSPTEQPAGTEDAPLIALSGVVDDLSVGQKLIISGEESDGAGGSTGEDRYELAEIAAIDTSDPDRTWLLLAARITYSYARDTVSISANVVAATHGETVSAEVLGSGDGASERMSLSLKKTPLTYVSASTPSGGESTMALRVSGLLWTEVANLYQQAADAEVYQIRVDDNDKTTITFGDGTSGARPATGQENITATYRFGLGEVGNVRASTLQILKKRPLGVRGVNNPFAATGGEDREALADARSNAPLTVLTLDRLVSVSDFEDFAAAFAGVAKALATVVWTGERRRIALTIAGTGGSVLKAGDEAYDNLLEAIDQYKDPVARVQVQGYVPRYFRVRAELKVDDAYVVDDVYAAAEAALRDAYSFDNRGFGQAVTAAEILTLLQGIAGVIAVDLNSLELLPEGDLPSDPEPPDPEPAPPDEATQETTLSAILTAQVARWSSATRSVLPAEILLLDSGWEGVLLQEMST